MPTPTSGTNTGHGHVWERPDGIKARCGGPALCSECAADQATLRSHMDFGQALTALKTGSKVTREGWRWRPGPDQFVVLQAGYPDGIAINKNTADATGIPQGTVCRFRPYLMLCAVDGSFVPWAPNVGDVLAEDWATA